MHAVHVYKAEVCCRPPCCTNAVIVHLSTATLGPSEVHSIFLSVLSMLVLALRFPVLLAIIKAIACTGRFTGEIFITPMSLQLLDCHEYTWLRPMVTSFTWVSAVLSSLDFASQAHNGSLAK